MADANTNIDANIKIAYFHDPVKWRNPKYPKYPKPDVRERIRVTPMTLVEVTAQDVLGGCLTRDGFNVLLIPGGFAPHWSDALGDDGERIIQRFVASGGGYVGLCAGAYYGVWSGLLPAEVVDIDHWQRGSTARCEIRWSSAGIDLLGAPSTSFVRYNNGPILCSTGAAARSLADFKTELRGPKNTFPPAMAGNSAVLEGTYGQGRVVLVSPHIECSNTVATTATLFCNLFRHVAAKPCQQGAHRATTLARACLARPPSRITAARKAATKPAVAPLRVQHIFAYGSLRPDDTSGMPWTKRFNNGLTARPGSIGPALLFEDEYASVVLGSAAAGTSARVTGFALGCVDTSLFAAKLRMADEIEGYEPRGGGLYERAVVDVRLEDGETVQAYVYHRPGCNRSTPVSSGDWLLRGHDAKAKEQQAMAPSPTPEHTPNASLSSSSSTSSDNEDGVNDNGNERSSTALAVEPQPVATGSPPSATSAPETTFGINQYAPVRLLAHAQRPLSAQPERTQPSKLSSATQKLLAARREAIAVANARSSASASTGVSRVGTSTRVLSASADGYSSPETYVCALGAPVLFTAPHGLKMIRGVGPRQSARNHARERYTTELVLKLSVKLAERRATQATALAAARTAPSWPSSSLSLPPPVSADGAATAQLASFMVWNYKTAAVDDPQNMDPNYLTKRTAVYSPWHSCLHAWKAAHGYAPTAPCPQLMHVDLHGKNDRADNMRIDVGMLPMEEEGCLHPRAVERIRAHLTAELRAAFDGYSAVSSKSGRRLAITVDEDPDLHGYWGEDTMMTMSHQSALLGALAIQLELPSAVRKLLMADGALFDAFATAILNTYDAALVVTQEPTAEPREGWEDEDGHGRYLATLGTARHPLMELAVHPSLGVEGVAAMLRDLERADQSSVHGKSI